MDKVDAGRRAREHDPALHPLRADQLRARPRRRRGPEPFELTKRFLDLAPGAFPGYSLLTAFGQAAPLNLEYQRAGRVLPFPFHFLNNNHAMNVQARRTTRWPEFYDRLIDLTQHSFSGRMIAKRFMRATASSCRGG